MTHHFIDFYYWSDLACMSTQLIVLLSLLSKYYKHIDWSWWRELFKKNADNWWRRMTARHTFIFVSLETDDQCIVNSSCIYVHLRCFQDWSTQTLKMMSWTCRFVDEKELRKYDRWDSEQTRSKDWWQFCWKEKLLKHLSEIYTAFSFLLIYYIAIWINKC